MEFLTFLVTIHLFYTIDTYLPQFESIAHFACCISSRLPLIACGFSTSVEQIDANPKSTSTKRTLIFTLITMCGKSIPSE